MSARKKNPINQQLNLVTKRYKPLNFKSANFAKKTDK